MKTIAPTKQQKLREELIEHNLTYNPQQNQHSVLGSVEYRTPSTDLLDKEETFYNIGDPSIEDARICASIITILILAKEASAPGQISRKNALASLRVISSIQFNCEGRTDEAIGKDLGRDRRIISNYNKRFMKWCATNGSDIRDKVSPEYLLILIFQFKRPLYSLHYAFDELRISLFSLMHKLIDAAKEGNTEVFRNPEGATDCEFTANVIKALSWKGESA